MPEIETENPEFRFVEVDRDEYMDLAIEWELWEFQVLLLLKMDKKKLV